MDDKLFEKCIKKLSYRMRTEKEMRIFLKKEECSSEEAENIIKELKALHYIDDLVYAEEFYRMCRGRAWGKNRIILELAKRGIGRELSEAAISAYLESPDGEEAKSDLELALEVMIKMREIQLANGKPLDDRFKAKVGRKLSSLGYSSGVCYKVLDKIDSNGLNSDH